MIPVSTSKLLIFPPSGSSLILLEFINTWIIVSKFYVFSVWLFWRFSLSVYVSVYNVIYRESLTILFMCLVDIPNSKSVVKVNGTGFTVNTLLEKILYFPTMGCLRFCFIDYFWFFFFMLKLNKFGEGRNWKCTDMRTSSENEPERPEKSKLRKKT